MGAHRVDAKRSKDPVKRSQKPAPMASVAPLASGWATTGKKPSRGTGSRTSLRTAAAGNSSARSHSGDGTARSRTGASSESGSHNRSGKSTTLGMVQRDAAGGWLVRGTKNTGNGTARSQSGDGTARSRTGESTSRSRSGTAPRTRTAPKSRSLSESVRQRSPGAGESPEGDLRVPLLISELFAEQQRAREREAERRTRELREAREARLRAMAAPRGGLGVRAGAGRSHQQKRSPEHDPGRLGRSKVTHGNGRQKTSDLLSKPTADLLSKPTPAQLALADLCELLSRAAPGMPERSGNGSSGADDRLNDRSTKKGSGNDTNRSTRNRRHRYRGAAAASQYASPS